MLLLSVNMQCSLSTYKGWVGASSRYTRKFLPWLFDSVPFSANNEFRDTGVYISSVRGSARFHLAAKQQGSDGREVIFERKELVPAQGEYVREPALTHEWTVGFWSIALFCLSGLPGVLPRHSNQLTKAPRKDSKHPEGGKCLRWRLERVFGALPGVQGRVPRADAELSPQVPGSHNSPSSQGEPEEGIARATGLGRAKGTSRLEKHLCVQESRFSLQLFLGWLLASLPSAPNQK